MVFVNDPSAVKNPEILPLPSVAFAAFYPRQILSFLISLSHSTSFFSLLSFFQVANSASSIAAERLQRELQGGVTPTTLAAKNVVKAEGRVGIRLVAIKWLN